jgi:hypothetical protein
MPREVPEIDRLIEEGLTLYGQGDLDGALLRWERALVIDPDNAQANSYVDYVRANYELLTTEIPAGEQTREGAPFGIADDEPEYQIEIQPGEIKASSPEVGPPAFIDPFDEGWLIDEETRDDQLGARMGRQPPETVEMEADEPPERPTAPAPPRPPTTPPAVTRAASEGDPFDAATREYAKREMMRSNSDPYGGFDREPSSASQEFGPDGTPGFGHPNDFQTPQGFGNQTTGVKVRDDLGFVQPVKPATVTEFGLPDPRPPAPPSTPPPASSMDELTLEPFDLPTGPRPALQAADLDEMDLIGSLPTPRPAPVIKQIEIDTPLSGAQQQQKVTTRDFPHQTRAPAFSTAKTRELPELEKPSIATSQTQDFDAKTEERIKQGNLAFDRTSEIPGMAQAQRLQEPLVSAPTRDLGLREQAAQVAARGDGTRADVVLPFDPIDARASEILGDVDEAAPNNEAREDKTRRRISTLFEKASIWSGQGDLERAVAAVDLALSEDPSSALAQKLIHRNRDTIMSVFQAYLGDLSRTPQLAKPLAQLANAPISPRAAFLLSRIDGLLSIDEILDVCGMPRLEAYRYLCQLFLRGILR